MGTLTFSYSIVDPEFSFESSSTIVTIIYTDPDVDADPDAPNPNADGNQNPDNSVSNKPFFEQLSVMSAMASQALAGHGVAVNQFLTLRNSDLRILLNTAFWAPARGGAAGGEDDSVGGLFMSLKQQDLALKTSQGPEAGIAGVTLGGDYMFNRQWFMGAALGYSRGEQRISDLDGAASRFNIAEKTKIIFTGWGDDAWQADAQIGYSAAEFDGNANACKALADCAVTRVEANSEYAVINAYYLWQVSGWRVTPGVSAKHQAQTLKTLGEASLVNNQQSETKALLSLTADKSLNFNWGVLMPRLMLTYNQQLNVSDSESTHMLTPEKHNVNIDIGSSILLPNGLAGFINVRTLVASDQYQSVSWELGVRKSL